MAVSAAVEPITTAGAAPKAVMLACLPGVGDPVIVLVGVVAVGVGRRSVEHDAAGDIAARSGPPGRPGAGRRHRASTGRPARSCER